MIFFCSSLIQQKSMSFYPLHPRELNKGENISDTCLVAHSSKDNTSKGIMCVKCILGALNQAPPKTLCLKQSKLSLKTSLKGYFLLWQ